MLRGKIPHFRLTCVAQKRRCLSSLLLISALSYFKAICTGQPGCANGGTCISPERCRCMPGWKGAKCRTGMYDTACKATDNLYTV